MNNPLTNTPLTPEERDEAATLLAGHGHLLRPKDRDFVVRALMFGVKAHYYCFAPQYGGFLSLANYAPGHPEYDTVHEFYTLLADTP